MDDVLFHLRAEADRTRAMRPDLGDLANQLATEAHDIRQFCIEDYVPEEDTTSYFLVYLNKLRIALTEFTHAAV